MMLAYMTADIGAHHARAWVLGHDMAGAWTNVNDLVQSGGTVERQPPAQVGKESAGYVIDSQHTRPLFDVLGICRLQLMELGFEVENYAELFYFIQDKLEQLLDWYYEARGWDANGLPTKDTLIRLDLGDVAEILSAEGVPIN